MLFPWLGPTTNATFLSLGGLRQWQGRRDPAEDQLSGEVQQVGPGGLASLCVFMDRLKGTFVIYLPENKLDWDSWPHISDSEDWVWIWYPQLPLCGFKLNHQTERACQGLRLGDKSSWGTQRKQGPWRGSSGVPEHKASSVLGGTGCHQRGREREQGQGWRWQCSWTHCPSRQQPGLQLKHLCVLSSASPGPSEGAESVGNELINPFLLNRGKTKIRTH